MLSCSIHCLKDVNYSANCTINKNFPTKFNLYKMETFSCLKHSSTIATNDEMVEKQMYTQIESVNLVLLD